MTSQIDIVNRALLSVGARAQISSISPSDGTNEANVSAVLFTPTFEALARSANWNCLRQQTTLSLLAAANGTPENPTGAITPYPPTPWLYEYAYPPLCLRMRFLVPSLPSPLGSTPPQTTFYNNAPTNLPSGGQIPFAIAYNTDASNNPIITVLTNQPQAQAVYTVNQPNPIIWDSQFQAAMVAALSVYLVPALSLNLPLMQASIALADKIIASARVSDGDEGVTVMDHLPDWIRARGVGAQYVPYVNSDWQYGNMAWPQVW